MGVPLDLNFNEFEAAVLFISVLLAVVVLQDGSSNYLKGAMLVVTYMFVAAGGVGRWLVLLELWDGGGMGVGVGLCGRASSGIKRGVVVKHGCS